MCAIRVRFIFLVNRIQRLAFIIITPTQSYATTQHNTKKITLVGYGGILHYASSSQRKKSTQMHAHMVTVYSFLNIISLNNCDGSIEM